jgi:hypothetical protein
MKRCPKCNRAYSTDTQKFCTHDGGLLFAVDETLTETVQFDSAKVRDKVSHPTTRDLGEQQAAFDPEATVVTAPPAEGTQPPRARDTGSLEAPQQTQYYGTPPATPTSGPVSQPTAPTVMSSAPPPPAPAPLPPPQPATSGPIAPPTQTASGPITPAAPPATPSGPIVAPAAQATAAAPQPSQPLATAAPKKKSKLPLILGLVAVLLLLFVGAAAAAGYFFVIKPRQEAKAAAQRTVATEPTTTAPSLPTTTPAEPPKPSNEPPPYNPPADAAQFVNSQDELSDKLAGHYVDFSFYYPNRWEKDPTAGKGDSPNFVEVHRQLPPNFPQESVAVSWYDLQGEEHSFSDLAEKKSAQLKESIGEYRKVSEGPIKIGNYDGYELRFEGRSASTEKGQLSIWGRVVWLPSSEGSKTGVALLMFATSLVPDVRSIDDVGVKGELPMILESFRFGK